MTPPTPSDRVPARKHISNFCHSQPQGGIPTEPILTTLESDILAMITKCNTHGISSWKIAKLVNRSEADIDPALDVLIEQDLIKQKVCAGSIYYMPFDAMDEGASTNGADVRFKSLYLPEIAPPTLIAPCGKKMETSRKVEYHQRICRKCKDIKNGEPETERLPIKEAVEKAKQALDAYDATHEAPDYGEDPAMLVTSTTTTNEIEYPTLTVNCYAAQEAALEEASEKLNSIEKEVEELKEGLPWRSEYCAFFDLLDYAEELSDQDNIDMMATFRVERKTGQKPVRQLTVHMGVQ